VAVGAGLADFLTGINALISRPAYHVSCEMKVPFADSVYGKFVALAANPRDLVDYQDGSDHQGNGHNHALRI